MKALLVALAVCGCVVSGYAQTEVVDESRLEFGFGFSAEMIDIAGGGAFAEVFVEFPFAYVTGLRATFSVGPLPVRASVFIVDVMGFLEFRWGDFRPYVAGGFGLGAPLDSPTDWFPVVKTAVGMNIIITEQVGVYVQIMQPVFSYGNFTTFFSPGFAFKFRM